MRKILFATFLIYILFKILPSPASDSSSYLSEEDRKWISEGHIVRVRVGNWPPFMFDKGDGKFEGLSVDYIEKIFKTHGIKYKFVSGHDISWPNALEDIKKNRKIDLILTAKITEKRKKDMLFTDEYLFLPWAIFNRKDSSLVTRLEDLNGKTVCVPKDYVMHDLLRDKYPLISLKVEESSEAVANCVKYLSEGKVDAYVGNLAVVSYIIQEYGYQNVRVAAPTPFKNHNQAMAVRKDWPGLVSIINKTLSHMDVSEHEALKNRWLAVRYAHGIRPLDLFIWIISLSCGFIFIIIMTLLWNRRLKREISERKRLGKKLKESENKYKSLSDASFEGIVVMDRGIIIESNSTMASMFQYSRDELYGKKGVDLVVSEHRKVADDKMKTNFIGSYEIDGLKKDGTTFPIEVQSKIFKFEGRKVRVAAVRDLTEKKSAEKEIKRLQEIIPICVYCKEIRDDKGYWNQLEKYISDHSKFKFSHSICDKCMEKYYPEIKSRMDEKSEE